MDQAVGYVSGVFDTIKSGVVDSTTTIGLVGLTATTVIGILGTRSFMNAANHVSEREACASRLINRSALVLTVAALSQVGVVAACCMSVITLTSVQALVIIGAISLCSYTILGLNNMLYLGEKETLIHKFNNGYSL